MPLEAFVGAQRDEAEIARAANAVEGVTRGLEAFPREQRDGDVADFHRILQSLSRCEPKAVWETKAAISPKPCAKRTWSA